MTDQAMSPLRRRMIEDMILRKPSQQQTSGCRHRLKFGSDG